MRICTACLEKKPDVRVFGEIELCRPCKRKLLDWVRKQQSKILKLKGQITVS